MLQQRWFCAGFGPQKLAVLAAYVLRQSLLVWLKTTKADIELRQNIDPTVGARAPSVSGRSNIERAAAAAIASTQANGFASSSPFAQMDVMLENEREGVMDSATDSQLAMQQPSANDAFLVGRFGAGRSQNGRETDPLVGSRSSSSRSLQGPSFSSNAFSSFGANSPPSQQMPASPFSAADSAPHIMPQSNSNLGASSPTSPAGIPKPGRAPPPPPAAAVPASPFAMISPFAQASQSAAAAGFPPIDRTNSAGSTHSASSEQDRRPTVRFAEEPIAPPANNSRTYNHTNSGFSELAMARSGSSVPQQQTPGHTRARSDLSQSGRGSGIQRSLSRNRSLSKQERAASATLDALDMPPLPLPAEAGGGPEDALSPVVSRQPSRQMSMMARQMSGFRYFACKHTNCMCTSFTYMHTSTLSLT